LELELLDVRVIPAAQQALRTLNQLLRTDANYALLSNATAMAAGAAAGNAVGENACT
jgi:hypothetical protein